MITVAYIERPGSLSLVIKGHAGTAEHGHDIVCASASMLAYTLAAGVSEASECGKLRCDPFITLSPGFARVCCLPFLENHGEIRAMYDLIFGGYRLLSSQYPDNVKLIYDATPERACHK